MCLVWVSLLLFSKRRTCLQDRDYNRHPPLDRHSRHLLTGSSHPRIITPSGNNHLHCYPYIHNLYITNCINIIETSLYWDLSSRLWEVITSVTVKIMHVILYDTNIVKIILQVIHYPAGDLSKILLSPSNPWTIMKDLEFNSDQKTN